jgi:hypothetical protein
MKDPSTRDACRGVLPRAHPFFARALPIVLALYCAASFVHFSHNAEFLRDYPNLPAWLTRGQVYAVWLGITALGATGYLLLRACWRRLGLAVLAVYAAIGFDGLLHYTRAPLMAHSGTMNVTIWSEVVAATLVLVAVVGLLAERSRPS